VSERREAARVGHRRCEGCAHYRDKRHLEDLYKLPTDKPNQAVREMRGREAEWEEEESESLLDLLNSGADRWPTRPHVLPYCGLEEERGVHLVHESKDAGGRCGSYLPLSQSPSRHCSDCVHRVQAPGAEEDRKEAERIVILSRSMGTYEPQPQGRIDSGWNQIKQLLQERSERLDDLKYSEMLAALDSGGFMPSKPRYFDTCRKFSGSGSHALCRALNHDGHCPGHAGRAPHATVAARARGRGWDDGGRF
jgi:hypothetical protein